MIQPNLVFVFPDQMRGSALGFLGEEPVQTPCLDRFSEQSLVLDQACATFPICSPFRAMLMSGRYPYSNGVIGNCQSKSAPYGVELRSSETCWSDVLNQEGYSLGYIGKWHLDAPHPPYIDCRNNEGDTKWNEWCPPQRRHGFQFWYSYGTYDYHDRPLYWNTDAEREQFHFVDQWGPEHEADLAIEYLKNPEGKFRSPSQPFALVVSMNPPHMPYDRVPQKYVDRYDPWSEEALCQRPNIPPANTPWGSYYREHIRNYYAMISGVDEQFGRILEALESTGLSENTLVIFTSDHGDCLGIHHQQSKKNLFEESLRIPFLARWPGQLPPGRKDLLLSAPDIYPTLLGLMGFEAKIPRTVEGTNLAPAFLGRPQEEPVSQFYLNLTLGQPEGGCRGIRNHRYTFARDRSSERKKTYLYDRDKDPFQLENIAEKYPERVRQLDRELQQWLQKTNDPWAANKPGMD